MSRLMATGIAAALVLGIACRHEHEDPPPTTEQPTHTAATAPNDTTAAGQITASDTIRRVNALRRAGKLQEMAQYVAEGRQRAVIEMIQAVDQVIRDNRILQLRLGELGYDASAILLDRSEVANIIDVFSSEVEVVHEQTDGDTAVVTIQVGGRLPLSEVRLELHGSQWIIQPDAPIPGMADEIRNLGKALRRVVEATRYEEMTFDQIAKELHFWQRPVMARIRDLADQAEAGPPGQGSSGQS